MIICPSCSFLNREGYFFCEDCGNSLLGSGTIILRTRQILDDNEPRPHPAPRPRSEWGTTLFSARDSLVFRIRDVPAPVMVKPGDRTLLGRSDASSNQKPDLDLAPYGAIEKGVSRVHAAIDRQEDTLTLVDMGSSNGTRLNGTALPPNEPHILRDGDEIEMGKMTIHIYFEERASGELHS